VYGVYADAQGQTFRDQYKAEYLGKGGKDGVMGLVYTGGGYDSVQLLAKAWSKAAPEDFKAVNTALQSLQYRGVNGFYRFDNPNQSPPNYPLEVNKPEEGIAQLFFQVQGGEHRIVAPDALKQSAFKPAPWMK